MKTRVETLTKELVHKNASDQHGFTGEFYETFKGRIGQLHKFCGIGFEGKCLNYFYRNRF